MTTHVNPDGSGYGVGAGGVVTTGPGGKVTSGGSNKSRNSRNNNSSYDRSNDYIETIEYSPNYTGQDNSEWCEKCKKVAPAHKHIKKRVY